MHLKTENCYLKIYIKIRVNKKMDEKYVLCYLKIKNDCLKICTKHLLNCFETNNIVELEVR